MEESEKEIDIPAVARQTLQDRQPGEDLDETLLRACKHLYRDRGITVFEAVRDGVAAVAEAGKVDIDTALKQVAEGKASLRVRTVINKSVNFKLPSQSLGMLSAEMRAEVEKAIASGKPGKVILSTKVVKKQKPYSVSSEAGQAAPQTYHCPSCGYESEIDFSSCPQCGKAKRRSLWSRLFK